MTHVASPRLRMWGILVPLLCLACGPSTEPWRSGSTEKHTLLFAGDLTFGRGINLPLRTPEGRSSIFAPEVRSLLASADATIVNGEGVLSYGGRFSPKGESRPYMYRAHPDMVSVLEDVGVDVVAVGNNHSGDYGHDAFAEMLGHLTAAGIDYTGGGHDLADAREPAFVKLGDTIVAIVGADLTYTKQFQAGKEKPGTLYFSTKEDVDHIADEFKTIVDSARRHAHLVVLTPHWGGSFLDSPGPRQRELAAALVKTSGFDGIFGHSNHWFLGVELIDGKPVVYDAGNLVVDYPTSDPAHRAFVWSVDVDGHAITALVGHPIFLEENHTGLPTQKWRGKMLKKLVERSAALGTTLSVEGGLAKVSLQPNIVRVPIDPQAPKREIPAAIGLADQVTVLDSIPGGVERMHVSYANGIELVGTKLVADKLRTPKAAQAVYLYFVTPRPVEENLWIRVEARTADGERIEPAPHIAGDWLLPTDAWPPDAIIQDSTIVRLDFKPRGQVRFVAGLSQTRDGPLVQPIDGKVGENGWVDIGTVAYSDNAGRVFEYLQRWWKESAPRTRQHRGAW